MTNEILIGDPPARRSRELRDDISVGELLEILWAGRVLIFVLPLVLGGVFLGYGLSAPRQYEAFITVLPVQSTGSRAGGVGALLSQVGDLASLAGLSGTNDSKRAESVAVLQSEALTERYISENNLLPILYKQDWDPQKRSWKTTTQAQTPTVWKANRFFKKKIRGITEDKTGLLTMRITWGDPKLAAQWANGLVAMTNQYLRDKAIRESDRNIAYLNEQAAKTNVVEVRDAIFTALQSEIKTAMVAQGTDEYALKVVDPAIPPEVPANPEWWLWLFGGLLAGFAIAVPVVMVRSGRRAPR